MSHKGGGDGGQNSAKKVSRIIWMDPFWFQYIRFFYFLFCTTLGFDWQAERKKFFEPTIVIIIVYHKI
jgi:hypothetical protein